MKRKYLYMTLVGIMLLMGISLLTVGMNIWEGQQGERISGKIPWSLYQEALRWQALFVPMSSIPEVELLLFTTQRLTEEELTELSQAGYALEAVVGTFVKVSAPITLYIDAKKGLHQFDYVAMAIYPIAMWLTGGGIANRPGLCLTYPPWKTPMAPQSQSCTNWKWLPYY